jgi:hypothetical protein
MGGRDLLNVAEILVGGYERGRGIWMSLAAI